MTGLVGRIGVVSRHFGGQGRGLGLAGGRGVLDDVSRRVGVLAKRAATALSRVEVVCHDAADYQPWAIGEVPEDQLWIVDLQVGGGGRGSGWGVLSGPWWWLWLIRVRDGRSALAVLGGGFAGNRRGLC
ncbi:hypothetical protein [Actinoplanes nipponensis]|uniref:hypothetical protein n=1 Tax=Actinoplanes nipponensis TaxID=135950 RepID=UPI001940DEEC|nr:hypothetical protein [Actinoplanes nipponensis]